MESLTKFGHNTLHHKTTMLTNIMSAINSVIESPIKSLAATLSGFITSFIPAMINDTLDKSVAAIESVLQILVLFVSFLLAGTSLITWWQKQADRCAKLKKKDKDEE